jgi:DNA-directed RNA polymerase subunit RPC12/RpoP
MDTYTATALAYNNGYEQGYEQGKKDAVKHGRWVYDEHEMEYSCSVCLCEAPVGMTTYYTTDYCPHCGSRMDGGNDVY